jgi:diaminopimelate decarboxylase
MTDYFSLPTPSYVFDFDEAKRRAEKIRSRLPQNASLCYAIKANAFLLHALKNLDGILFEVCSEGELEICRALNVDAKKIVFSGIMKNREMIKKALEFGVKTVTIESISHLNDLISVLDAEKNQEVILRFSSGNQFGMDEGDFCSAMETILKNRRISLRGIHYFSGTQKKISKIKDEIVFIESFAKKIEEKFGVKIPQIEYGAGLSFDYFSAEDFAENFSDLDELSLQIKNSRYEYTVELGRFVAATSGSYVTKICDIKKTQGVSYAILDGGINHINYYGQIMAMKIPRFVHLQKEKSSEAAEEFCLCGSLCTTADVISKKAKLSAPNQGDILVFKNIGAYSITEGIYLFLSHDLPSVFAVENGQLKMMRDKKNTFPLNC